MRPRPYADGWRFKDDKELDWKKRFLRSRMPFLPPANEFQVPVHTGKVPMVYELDEFWASARWVFLPTILRYAFMKVTGYSVPPVLLFFLHVVHTMAFLKSYQLKVRSLIIKYGYLDGEVPRDTISEPMTTFVFENLISAILVRPLFFFLLAYRQHELPSLSLWLPLQLFCFTMIVDFIYYWGHRATHEVDALWTLHKTHHTTKHPNPFLAGFSEEVQAVFDALGTPVLTYMVYPISFDALYIWSLYFISIEVMGHSGLRVYYPGVLTSFLLRPFNLNIVVEDHDLHHRYGWGKSYNYGKQSVFWDQLFGTRGERLELRDDNVDWHTRVDVGWTKE